MLKLIFPTIMLLPSTWYPKNKMLWIYTTIHSLLISLVAPLPMNQPNVHNLNLSLSLSSPPLSTPLLMLTFWLLPLILITSQNHLSKGNPPRNKLFISMLFVLQMFLTMTFSATELILFYILLEATLIPTLIIVTRWGNQTEWLNAGTYFLFYTLSGSLPAPSSSTLYS